jgi:hypothetical protein
VSAVPVLGITDPTWPGDDDLSLTDDRPYCPVCGMTRAYRWAGCAEAFHDDLEERLHALFDGWVS